MLIRVSLPIVAFLFFENLTTFIIETVCLSYAPSGSVQGALGASYLATMFQVPFVAVCAMGQVLVGVHQGSGELEKIGPTIWQLIWLSLFSLVVSLPLSYAASMWYFEGTLIQQTGIEYFTVLALGNFLFPLSTALSSFYLGRGKTTFVTISTIGSHVAYLALSVLLIFGAQGVVQPLGVKGAGIAKCVSVALLCGVQLLTFLMAKHGDRYGTRLWRFSLPILWSCMKPGLVRASGFFSAQVCWVAVAAIMIRKGGIYLDALTVGGVLINFFSFVPGGLYRAVLTIASNIMGAKLWGQMWHLCRCFTLYTGIVAALMAIPLCLFPGSVAGLFHADFREMFNRAMSSINLWVWAHLVTLTLQMSLCGLLVVMQDLKVQLYMYLGLWITGFIPIYWGIGQNAWEASTFWVLMVAENVLYGLLFYIRLRKQKWGEVATFGSEPT